MARLDIHEPQDADAPIHLYLGMTRGALVAFLMIVAVAIFGAFRLESAIHQNDRAIAFICSTTQALDELVVQAHDQINTSIRNGTYQRLIRQKVLKPQNLVEAEKTRDYYERVHLQLNGPQSQRCHA